ncbi:MAG: hypothetical protein ACYC4L_00960 [Chloroflexota bacterium]
MAVMRLNTARRRFPEAEFPECQDPKHDPTQSREPVAVVDHYGRVFAVCKSCLPRVLGEQYTDN